MIDTINTNQQQTTDATQAGTGGEKLFTQADLDRIIGERLSRVKGTAADDETYKAQYEAVKKELDGIKAEQARAAKEAAVRAYYQQKGVTGKALEIAMKGSAQEIDALELTDGQVKDFAAIDSLIGGVFAGLVAHTTTVGAPVAHPPGSYQPPADDRLSDIFKPKI